MSRNGDELGQQGESEDNHPEGGPIGGINIETFETLIAVVARAVLQAVNERRPAAQNRPSQRTLSYKDIRIRANY